MNAFDNYMVCPQPLFSGTTLPASLGAAASAYLSTQGYNTLMLNVNVTWAAATNVNFVFNYVDPRNSQEVFMTAVAVAGGVATRTRYFDRYALGGASARYKAMIATDPSEMKIRVYMYDQGGTATTDTVTVYWSIANLSA